LKSTIDRFLKYLEIQKRYSRHTIVAYQNDLRTFADHMDLCFDVQSPMNTDKRMISSFVADLIDAGLNPRSVNRKLSAIQSYFDFLLREDLIKANPAKAITRPKSSQRLPSVLRKEQVDALFDGQLFPLDFTGARDKAILELFYSCGIRRDELIGLKLDDVNLGEHTIKVLGKRKKERLIPISSRLEESFRDYMQVRQGVEVNTDCFFVTDGGNKLYPSLVYNTVKIYLSKVTTMDKRSPHVLRHTFATHLLNEGANLQSIKELLGHTSLAATQVYTHTSLEKLKDVYRNTHPRNKK
jgi:integrase/recombinase XerC